eukprot:gene13833-18326_t
MGCEFAQWEEWNADAQLHWHLLGEHRHQGLMRLVRDLNNVMRHFPALHQQDVDAAGFEWLRHGDAENSVLAFTRRDRAGRFVIVVCHFTPAVRHGYRLGVPAAGRYRELINTDLPVYGGSGVSQGPLDTDDIGSDHHGQSLLLTLPPLSTLMLAEPCLPPGDPHALGATLREGGGHFAVWAPEAESVWLCAFDDTGKEERRRWRLTSCQDGVWHGFLAGAQAGMVYGWRVQGRWAPQE